MRTEKGLLLKDWGLLKSQGKGIIYVMIGGAALMVGALNNSVIDREESAGIMGFSIFFRCRSRKRIMSEKNIFSAFLWMQQSGYLV